MSDMVREATLADVPQIADVFAAGFVDDDIFGRFMHPKRRKYPDDWLRHWNKYIRTYIVDPAVIIYVRTNESGMVKASCVMRRLGRGGQNRVAAGSLTESIQAGAENKWDNLTWNDRSADPKALEIFEKNWGDIKHHFTGPREECWMIELFCVAPDAQKSGYGRLLIHKAIELCKSEDPAVPLCVIAGETGDAFYEKTGFREVGRANVRDMSDVVGGSIKFYERHLER